MRIEPQVLSFYREGYIENNSKHRKYSVVWGDPTGSLDRRDGVRKDPVADLILDPTVPLRGITGALLI